MKAVVFHGIGEISLDEVPEPELRDPTDAIVRLTTSAICGTDLHFVRGTFSGMKPGTIIGHEGVGVVEALGPEVRNLNVGDRVIPELLELVRAGAVRPSDIITQREPLTSAVDAFRAFDRREAGWLKIRLGVSDQASVSNGGRPQHSVHVAP